MRICELFTVPEGKKITEKMMVRVMVSSICSILLCMTCLVSTTWAWFTVSIENEGNVIQTASVELDVEITGKSDETAVTVNPDHDSYSLRNGTYTILLDLKNDASDSDHLGNAKGPAYVLMSTSNEQYFVFTFDAGQGSATSEIKVYADSVDVTFSVIWIAPVSAENVGTKAIEIGKITESVEMAATQAEETSVSTDPPEIESDPIEESSKPTDTETNSTEPSTEPKIEPPTNSVTESSTEMATLPPAEDDKVPTEETTQLIAGTTEPTGAETGSGTYPAETEETASAETTSQDEIS